MDSASVYTACRNRLFDLAGRLTPEQSATPVPACPAWNVRQLYAHLAGVCVDVGRGLVPPSDDAATARQVDERAEDGLSEICDEWRAATPTLMEVLTTRTGARFALPTFDVWHHENDLHGALGLAPQTEGADELAVFGFRLRAHGWDDSLPGVRVRVEDTGQEVLLGSEADLELRADAFELARVVAGRRSVAQIGALKWSGDPSAVAGRLPNLPAPRADLAL